MAFSLNRLPMARLWQQKSVMLGCGAVLAGLALGACSSTSPSYYTLMQQDGASYPASLGAVRTVKVLASSVPEQLDRDTIVMSGQSYRMAIEEGATWSEPLGTLIGHTLAGNLRERLPGRVIFSQNDVVAEAPQASVSLSISRFDLRNDNHAVIDGVLSIETHAEEARSVHSIPVHWVSPRTVQAHPRSFVEALSEGLGTIADQATQQLSEIRAP